MTAGWEYPVAAFRRGADQPPTGTGVLVAGDVVLTCAHVLEDSLQGVGTSIGLGSKTSVDFPFAGVRGLEATVVGWHPAVPELNLRRDGLPTDLAVLKLEDPDRARSIEACLIAETDPVPHTAFTCKGFPEGYPNGEPAEGTLRGTDAAGWIEAIANDQFGYFVEPGYSGAPVFARQQHEIRAGTVLGLCVTADVGGKRVARMIPPAQLAAALRAVVSPYRWLEYFSQREAAYFFGREDLIDELSLHLGQHRFLVLAGPSGSGKSSLLRAGLLSAAQRSDNETFVVRPLDDTWRELGHQLGLPPVPAPSEQAVRQALEARLLDARRLKKTFLMAIDQAEELVQGKQQEYAANFLEFLGELRNENQELQIALATRSDALPLLLAVQPRSPRLVERNLRHIDQLGRDDLRAACERPGARLRVIFDPGLPEIMANDVLQEHIPLPVFQLCLSKLWESRTDAIITAAAYHDLGGLTGVLARHADAWLERIRPNNHTLLKLVDMGPQRGEDRRRRVPLSDFDAQELEVMRSLASERLVLISRDTKSSENVAELAHDSLLTEWIRLRDLIEENRPSRALLRGEISLDNLIADYLRTLRTSFMALFNEAKKEGDNSKMLQVNFLLSEINKRTEEAASSLLSAGAGLTDVGKIFADLSTVLGTAGDISNDDLLRIQRATAQVTISTQSMTSLIETKKEFGRAIARYL